MTEGRSAPLLPEQETMELLDQLRALSSRPARLGIAVGLLAVMLGFVIITWRLSALYRAAEAHAAAEQQQKEEKIDQIGDLTATLNVARTIAAEPHGAAAQGEQWQRLSRLLSLADSQAGSLEGSVKAPLPDVVEPAAAPTAAASPAAPAPAQASVVRLFVHIMSEDQRPAAMALKAAWSGRTIGNTLVLVPGIELVGQGGDNSVRCTRADSCARVALVTRWINDVIGSPKLHAIDLSRRYRNATNIRPGTYEVWFAPGPIDPGTPVAEAP